MTPTWKRAWGAPVGDGEERETKTAASRTCVVSVTNQ
jgi:hypothetical protein